MGRQNDGDERDQEEGNALTLPARVAGSGALDRLVDAARDCARAAASQKTLKAYRKTGRILPDEGCRAPALLPGDDRALARRPGVIVGPLPCSVRRHN